MTDTATQLRAQASEKRAEAERLQLDADQRRREARTLEQRAQETEMAENAKVPVDDSQRVLVGGGTEADRPDYRDLKPNGQQKDYVVLSDAERAKGFVRPVRRSYQHVGRPGPKFPLRGLTDEQKAAHGDAYVKYEPYPESMRPSLGRYWAQEQLDKVGKGCGTVTTMSQTIAETYARSPGFYGATFCCGCGKHLPVGADGEFVWDDGSQQRVGT